ncbi:phage portal protein [Candidatus Deianiraea vastatrix]|uniref:Phage portal protein HK97 family n=1 Tax=Candidatus Deianiraea vastatrix TaxID=2163644 RepID=A0A5B8XDT6_9RICK|nr:phage portal protein [Candidatus Deianiraea vastatrix]QED23472.1 Putative phage portal protein HK97 family [Candidatus Deianiraea vastatrix]
MFFAKKNTKEVKKTYSKSYVLNSNTKASWSDPSYSSLAYNGYASNVVANRCIKLISQCVSSIRTVIYGSDGAEMTGAQINDLIAKPNDLMSQKLFFETIVKNLLIFGNSYIKSDLGDNQIDALHVLPSDLVSIVVDSENNVMQYAYNNGQKTEILDASMIGEVGEVLHIKLFNPNDKLYGLSPLYTARFSIDQYNEAIAWNKCLLQNGARPSGALVVEANGNDLTDEQFSRLSDQLRNDFTGSLAAGKVMILEGGLKWQEMSISPKDMEFIETKNSAARDIALAFGVPSNLLGIQGDNTYNNFAESRIALWEETILPLAELIFEAIATHITAKTGEKITILADLDQIPTLVEKRYTLWKALSEATFLTDAEKRTMAQMDA